MSRAFFSVFLCVLGIVWEVEAFRFRRSGAKMLGEQGKFNQDEPSCLKRVA
jgi:hypothetical protein